MKTIAHSSGSASTRPAYWLVAAIAVLGAVFAIIEMSRTPDRVAVSATPIQSAPAAAASSALVGAVRLGTGVPDASTVFRGRETTPEESAPTF